MNTIKFEAAVSENRGKIRKNNEDNFYFNGRYLTEDNRDDPASYSENPEGKQLIFAVFDGMGGEEYGEEASLIAAKEIKKYHKTASKSADTKMFIPDFVESANARICNLIIEKNAECIGTTMAVLSVENDNAEIYNVGDSRVYIYRNGRLRQISVEDTASQRLINLGVITKEQAKKHPERHKITQHLGIFPEEMTIDIHKSDRIEIKRDDIFLLCSDGLTDMVEDSDICKILGKSKKMKDASEALVRRALDNGGIDNVTVMLIKASTGRRNNRLHISKKKCFALAAAAAIILGITSFLIFKSGGNHSKTVGPAHEEPRLYWSTGDENGILAEIGATGTLLTGREPSDMKGTVEYTSSDPHVVSIDKTSGTYTAIAEGTATITASLNGSEIHMNIQVLQSKEQIKK